MNENIKKNWFLILVGVVTLALGVIAIVTTLRLYKVGKKPVAPTAPLPAPAAGPSCTRTFTIITPTPSARITCLRMEAYRVGNADPSLTNLRPGQTVHFRVAATGAWAQDQAARVKIMKNGTLVGTFDCIFSNNGWHYEYTIPANGLGNYEAFGYIRSGGQWSADNPSCKVTFSVTTVPTPTPTIVLARCYENCGMVGGSLVGCISGLQCLKDPNFPLVFKCRNPQCPTVKNCVCGGTTPTPTGTRAPTPTPTTTLSPTPTPTPTGTLGPTPTPGPTATPKPTPTAYAKLPEAGFTLPTIGALFGAIVLVVTSLILLF